MGTGAHAGRWPVGTRGDAADRRRGRTIASEAPVEARQFIDGFERFQTRWYTETLPTLAASFKLALEVFETFGPGRTCIEDPTEAVSWGIALTAQLAAPSHVRCKAPHNSVRDACGVDPDRGAGSAGSARRRACASEQLVSPPVGDSVALLTSWELDAAGAVRRRRRSWLFR